MPSVTQTEEHPGRQSLIALLLSMCYFFAQLIRLAAYRFEAHPMRTTIKKLLTLGIPLAASRFMHTLNTFIVMLFIAQLGHDALAASFTMATTRIIMLVIFMSPLFAIGSLVSRQ